MNYESCTDRELDAMVAERVMGWKHLNNDETSAKRAGVSRPIYESWIDGKTIVCTLGDFCPTTDHSAWWSVVEKMQKRPDDAWFIEIRGTRVLAVFRPAQAKDIHAWQAESVASTPGRAVCISALKSLDAQERGEG
jgi:hypothetical protein